MAKILLIEDDPAQLPLRQAQGQYAGREVVLWGLYDYGQ